VGAEGLLMSITISFHQKARRPAGLLPSRSIDLGQWLRIGLPAVALAIGAHQLVLAMQSPGQAIRSNLRDAAAEAHTLAMTASPAEAQQAIESYFAGRTATVDARGFPTKVLVTLHGLDRSSCTDAAALTRRLEGRVVVELIGYRTAEQCAENNDMTWRIMP
jgi:hypothetical protein